MVDDEAARREWYEWRAGRESCKMRRSFVGRKSFAESKSFVECETLEECKMRAELVMSAVDRFARASTSLQLWWARPDSSLFVHESQVRKVEDPALELLLG